MFNVQSKSIFLFGKQSFSFQSKSIFVFRKQSFNVQSKSTFLFGKQSFNFRPKSVPTLGERNNAILHRSQRFLWREILLFTITVNVFYLGSKIIQFSIKVIVSLGKSSTSINERTVVFNQMTNVCQNNQTN